MTRKRGDLFARISLDYPDHPKIAALSDGAFRAHVEMILWARRYMTDGRIPNRVANRFGFESVSELCSNDADRPSLIELDDGDYQLHDFADHQETRADVEARRLVNAENGRRGGRPAKQTGKRTKTHSVSESVSGSGTDSGTEMKAETETEIYTPLPPRGNDDADDDFAIWWDTYDNKKSRPVAERRWRIALTKRGVTPQLLIDAAEKYIAHQRSIGKHPEYTKNPGTWLNQECWNDELAADRAPVAVERDDSWISKPAPDWMHDAELVERLIEEANNRG